MFSTHVSCAGRGVTVSSLTRAVADWPLRYLGPWWSVTAAEGRVERLVRADVSPDEALDAIGQVLGNPVATSVRYAGEELVFLRRGTVVHAAQDGLAYRYTPGGELRIVGLRESEVAVAAVRLAREMLRGRLLADGWLLLRASAVVGSDGRAVLVLGEEGAGKTTAAFLLAQVPGWSLLSDDRVLVRSDGEGRVRVLPWPSAAAVGFGLLEACGWYEPVRERLKCGELPHPTQRRQVTRALLAGDRRPRREADGAELKVRLWPDQLRDWLGLSLAAHGHGVVSRLLFPMTRSYVRAGRLNDTRRITTDDVITASRDEQYPDVFGFTLSCTHPRRLVEAMSGLRQDSVLLGRDADGNRAFLLDLVSQPL